MSTYDISERIRTRHGEHYAACIIVHRGWFGGGSAMVCGGISMKGHTNLYSLGNNTLTMIRLKSSDQWVRPYAGAVVPVVLLVHDNAQPQVVRVCRQFLEDEGLDTFD